MIFVGEDMAVPDVTAGFVEVDLYARTLFRKDSDHVFWGRLKITALCSQVYRTTNRYIRNCGNRS